MKSILIHMIFSAAISDYIIVCFVLLDHVVCISVTHINTPWWLSGIITAITKSAFSTSCSKGMLPDFA